MPAQQLDAMMQLQQQQMAFYQQLNEQLAASNSLMMSQLGFDASTMAALNPAAMLAPGMSGQYPQWGLPGMDPAMAAALGPLPGLSYAPMAPPAAAGAAAPMGLPGPLSDPAAAAAVAGEQQPRVLGGQQQQEEQ
jgi:hypothetical protein